jgi:ribulose-5-phosphate 4-epimerase/fuculose-1-phosphate aldolase
MGGPDTLQTKRPAHVPEEEWTLRVRLAACYRLFDWLDWTDSIFNHITVRVPGPNRHFLINPFGLYFTEVTASNLVKIDLDGNIIGKSDYPVNPAGFVIHSAIHAAREDAHCIMHTHTTEGMAVSCKKEGLAFDNFYGAQLLGQVAYHDFEGITVRDDEKTRLVSSLGNRNAFILRNHGLLSCGPTIATAFTMLRRLQRACEVQCVTDSMSGGNLGLTDEVRQLCTDFVMRARSNEGLAEREFDALVRRMEAEQSGRFGDFRC